MKLLSFLHQIVNVAGQVGIAAEAAAEISEPLVKSINPAAGLVIESALHVAHNFQNKGQPGNTQAQEQVIVDEVLRRLNQQGRSVTLDSRSRAQLNVAVQGIIAGSHAVDHVADVILAQHPDFVAGDRPAGELDLASTGVGLDEAAQLAARKGAEAGTVATQEGRVRVKKQGE